MREFRGKNVRELIVRWGIKRSLSSPQTSDLSHRLVQSVHFVVSLLVIAASNGGNQPSQSDKGIEEMRHQVSIVTKGN